MHLLESKDIPSSSPDLESTKNHNRLGLVVAGVIGSSALLLSAICAPFVTPALRKICLPYVPATPTQVSNVLKALRGRNGTLVDLGSGDGRIVFGAARQGFAAVGVELNVWLIIYSKLKALRLSTNATFLRRDIWKIPLADYENVVIFGVESMMEQLEVKCKSELKPNAVVVACRFPFPYLEPDKTIGEGIDKWSEDQVRNGAAVVMLQNSIFNPEFR